MRLWSLHPRYLDAKGLLAAWREALLAQKVLEGKTRGYRNHPQLSRFRVCSDPLLMIGLFLSEIADEASRRGYSFDRTKIVRCGLPSPPIPVTDGQARYELELLRSKLERRDRAKYGELRNVSAAALNGVFTLRSGGIAPRQTIIPEIAARPA